MPFLETFAAATGRGVLGDEHGVSPHGRLPAVVGNDGRGEACAHEVLRMAAQRLRAFAFGIGRLRRSETEPAAELRAGQPGEKLFELLPGRIPSGPGGISGKYPSGHFPVRCLRSGARSGRIFLSVHRLSGCPAKITPDRRTGMRSARIFFRSVPAPCGRVRPGLSEPGVHAGPRTAPNRESAPGYRRRR